MSQETQDFTQALGDKFNQMMDNPTLFSVDKTENQKNEDLRQKLIDSVEGARTNISQSVKNFREYYIQTYGIEKWVEFNKNPKMFGTQMFLVTGINPGNTTSPNVPEDLGFLSPSVADGDFRTSPSFYKKMYEVYLKNAVSSAMYYTDISYKSPYEHGDSISDSLYKLLNVDLDTQLKDRVNTSNVNERKAYYETQETNIMYNAIVALQTFYIRVLLLLCFIRSYVFFLTHEISIASIIKEFIYLALIVIIPYIIVGILQVLYIMMKKIYTYFPANTWITNMTQQPV
jgi:hypothetical protein